MQEVLHDVGDFLSARGQFLGHLVSSFFDWGDLLEFGGCCTVEGLFQLAHVVDGMLTCEEAEVGLAL